MRELTITCGLCSHERVFVDLDRVYERAKLVRVLEWSCWCWDCNDLSEAEYIPSPAEVIEEGKAWSRRDDDYQYVLTCGPFPVREDDGTDKGRGILCSNEEQERAMEYLEEWLVWAMARRSPGRCLFCGSTHVSLAKERWGDAFVHPGCGGIFRSRAILSAGVLRERGAMFVYSSEGIKVSEE